jgi:hypothetical protein
VFVLPWATLVERGARSDGLAVLGVSSANAPPSRCRAGDADVRDDPDEPPAISPDDMERLGLDSGDAVKMRLEAKQRRLAAERMRTCGDLVSPRFELAKAERLEQTAELLLDPVVRTTGPVTIGNGARSRRSQCTRSRIRCANARIC